MADKVSIGEIRRGEVTLVDLCKLNAILNMQAAAEYQARKAQPK